jgi:putative copper export protein
MAIARRSPRSAARRFAPVAAALVGVLIAVGFVGVNQYRVPFSGRHRE